MSAVPRQENTAHPIQAAAKVSEDYQSLKAAASDCIHQIQFSEDARQVFESNRVRKLLESIMDRVIKALELISKHYSGSRASEFIIAGFIDGHS